MREKDWADKAAKKCIAVCKSRHCKHIDNISYFGPKATAVCGENYWLHEKSFPELCLKYHRKTPLEVLTERLNEQS